MSIPRTRLFVAIILDPKRSRELDSLKMSLAIPGVKTTPDYHITLCFLGDLASALSVKTVLRTIRFVPFALTLDGFKVQPSLRNPEHIEMRFARDRGYQTLIDLQQKIATALKKAIGYSETWVFSPHVTLARVKFVDDPEQLSAFLRNIVVPKLSFEIRQFHLLQSDLRASGPVYTLLGAYPGEKKEKSSRS